MDNFKCRLQFKINSKFLKNTIMHKTTNNETVYNNYGVKIKKNFINIINIENNILIYRQIYIHI